MHLSQLLDLLSSTGLRIAWLPSAISREPPQRKLASLCPRWGLMPKEPVLPTLAPAALWLSDLASKLVPAGSFLPTVLLKKSYV